jgi:RNA polymerase sigma factor (sigma-70 family)
VTGGSLIRNADASETTSIGDRGARSSPPKAAAAVKGTAAESLVGAGAVVAGGEQQRRVVGGRRRVVKSLSKSRRDDVGINGNVNGGNGNGAARGGQNDGGRQKRQDQDDGGRVYDNPGRTATNDSQNLNRYYKTVLLTASEEYSLGMKVRFMVKCQAVHEGLTLQFDRNPTIAEWAEACGFDVHDPEMCSADYADSDLDRQIRPSGSDADEMDPTMFVGNGLVTETGVGRGKGRVKKPPPTSLRRFYDDSYEKFGGGGGKKRASSDNGDDGDGGEDAEGGAGTDIFLHRQRSAPGEPINRGSPRVFREMMLTAKEAKQRMVQCNMRLVVSIARRYHGVGVNVQDLVQEGSLGLARAAEKFDPKKGFKFSTYASWWIQQAVFRSIAYHSRTIRLPVHVHNLLNKVRRARQVLQQELGRVPSNEEMADEMDMSLEKYNKMIRNTRNAISLERPKYMNNPKDLGHESEALVGDMVDSSAVIFDEKTPEQNVDHGLLHSDIQYMLGVSSKILISTRGCPNDVAKFDFRRSPQLVFSPFAITSRPDRNWEKTSAASSACDTVSTTA